MASGAWAEVAGMEDTVATFKEACLNLSYYAVVHPQVYAPFELVPVYQKGFSYYAAVPHGFTAPALHTPPARGNASVRALMRRVDFYIMRQTWVLKDIQGWAEATATMVSVALSVAASVAISAAKEAILGGVLARDLLDAAAAGGGRERDGAGCSAGAGASTRDDPRPTGRSRWNSH